MREHDMTAYTLDAHLAAHFASPPMQAAVDRLGALGYAYQPGDETALALITHEIAWEIRNACGVRVVPEGLTACAGKLIAAAFLREKKESGQLCAMEEALAPAIKQITEGDTSVAFASGEGQSASQRLDALISSLEAGREEFAAYRRLRW